MNDNFLSTALILPLELLLPFLGILLIRSESPINSLIYRSFLGSIAALIYAIVGAPDVALTEIMVGTLLSSLIYIVTIRSCYTIVIIVDKASPPQADLKDCLKQVFAELHLRVVYLEEDYSSDLKQNLNYLSDSRLSGSPHLLIHGSNLYFEVESLLNDVKETAEYVHLKCKLNSDLVSSLS